jgi:L-threonylcarbamoyladenylate synthase
LTKPAPPELVAAATALKAGRLVIYPTETVYGLGAAALDPVALAALLALKGRPDEKGLSVLVAGLDAATHLLSEAPPLGARALAKAFWPGPLTIVLPASDTLPAPLRGETGGVGLRCSSDRVATALALAFGGPITATSANPSGARPAADVGAARAYFGTRVECYLDDGSRKSDFASSVVEFSKGRAILRRAGAITIERLASVVPLHTSES